MKSGCLEHPSAWALCPAIAAHHSGESRSSTAWKSRLVWGVVKSELNVSNVSNVWSNKNQLLTSDTRHPSPSQSSFELNTVWSARRPPRSRCSRPCWACRRTRSNWRSSASDQVAPCRRSRSENRAKCYSYDSVWRSQNRWCIQRTPRHSHNRDAHLIRRVLVRRRLLLFSHY